MSHSFSPDDLPRAGRRVQTNCSGFSRTQQHHAKECDISRIISRYARTGELPPGRGRPAFGDVTHLQGDITERLATAQSIIDQANADLLNHKNKQLSEQKKINQLKQQKIMEEKQKQERLLALKQELADLEGPPS